MMDIDNEFEDDRFLTVKITMDVMPKIIKEMINEALPDRYGRDIYSSYHLDVSSDMNMNTIVKMSFDMKVPEDMAIVQSDILDKILSKLGEINDDIEEQSNDNLKMYNSILRKYIQQE